jgi:hypothetical protein
MEVIAVDEAHGHGRGQERTVMSHGHASGEIGPDHAEVGEYTEK